MAVNTRSGAAFRDRRDPFGSLQYTVRNADGTETRLQAMDVLHIPGLGYDGCSGYSVIAKARESIGLGLAMQQFGASFFGNGSTFGGVFTASRPLSPKEKADLETSLRHYHEGLDRAHRFMVLDGGFDYKRLGIPPDDAQFLESREFQVAEIARLFNVPPHKLADLDRATFSNIESQQIWFCQDTLRPWLVRWEQEINRKLLSPQEQDELFAEHLIDGLLRGDAQGRAAFYTAMSGVGGITINEIGARENLDPIEGGDTVYLPADVVLIDRVGELPMATPEASARELPRQLVEFSVTLRGRQGRTSTGGVAARELGGTETNRRRTRGCGGPRQETPTGRRDRARGRGPRAPGDTPAQCVGSTAPDSERHRTKMAERRARHSRKRLAEPNDTVARRSAGENPGQNTRYPCVGGVLCHALRRDRGLLYSQWSQATKS